MEIQVTPPLPETERQALRVALEDVGTAATGDEPYRQAWRLAALREGVEDDESEGYAPSPRSTRGATRA